MKKILSFLLPLLIGIIVNVLILSLIAVIAYKAYIDKKDESIWKGKIDTSWYNDSQTDFTITTPEQLAGFAKLVNDSNDFKGKTVNLGASIDLKKKDWTPIGKGLSTEFKGTFDGKGFVVSGLYMKGDLNGHGLFGRNNGTIKNLGITDSYVSGDWVMGGLAGSNDDAGSIDNCYFSGTLELKREYGGGLVGINKGSITNSYSADKVMMIKASAKYRYYLGGLVGDNRGEIINSYSTSAVEGTSGVGGLAGDNSGTIKNSYSTGAVNGHFYVGGFVGSNNGNIINSYSAGAVTGERYVGGFVGNAYSRGELNVIAIHGYYDKQISNQSDGIGNIRSGDKIEGKIEGKTTAEMKRKSTFTNWDFDNTWGIDDTVNGGYPYLLNSPPHP